LENDNRFFVVADGNGMRGWAMTDVFIDESAYMTSKRFEELITCIFPTLTYNQHRGRIFMLSTPNGKNHFHAAFLRFAARPEEWFAFQLAWYDIPDKKWNTDAFKYLDKKQADREYRASFL
jgi:hypothetical protein